MHKAVIGLGFGDEGKGLTVDYLASRHPDSLDIRFSGGHQVGHTVVSGDKRHVFSNFGSGTFRGVSTYWSEHCPVCPRGIINELADLKDKCGLLPDIYIDCDAPLVTPMDRNSNRSLEKDNKHGSCGVGFGTTIQREEDFFSLRFEDIFYPDILEARLKNISQYYYKLEEFDFEDFLDCCAIIRKYKGIVPTRGIPDGFSDFIFEGSQGLLLDQRYGFFPNVTRSNIGSKNIEAFEGNIEWFLVTRAYQTRHGNGFMTNEELSHNIKSDENETNVSHEYQGEFRRTLLDVSLLEYAINKDRLIRESRNKNLVITCLDHIENEYRFTYKGEIIGCCDEDDFVDKVSNILGIKNVYISSSSDSANMQRRNDE